MVPGPTTLIKPEPCKVPTWDEFPQVYTAEGCPEGMVCTWDEDHDVIVAWVVRAIRYHDFIDSCPYVKEAPPTLGQELDKALNGTEPLGTKATPDQTH